MLRRLSPFCRGNTFKVDAAVNTEFEDVFGKAGVSRDHDGICIGISRLMAAL